MRAISRNENAQRAHHGGIRGDAKDLGLQPRPTAAIMRTRIASSGSSPVAAAMFSHT